MLAAATLDSKISETFDWNRQLKCCTAHTAGHYSSLSKCGCSSVVEHLLAKEDVASSSLVTRSPAAASRGRGVLTKTRRQSAVATRNRAAGGDASFTMRHTLHSHTPLLHCATLPLLPHATNSYG